MAREKFEKPYLARGVGETRRNLSGNLIINSR